jgi:Bacterial Ig-like domain (group 3)
MKSSVAATLAGLLILTIGAASARGIRVDNSNWTPLSTQSAWTSALSTAGYPTDPVTGQRLLLFNFGGPPADPATLFGPANLQFFEGNSNVPIYNPEDFSNGPIDAQTLPDYALCLLDSNCSPNYPDFTNPPGGDCVPTPANMDLDGKALDYFECNVPPGALNVQWGPPSGTTQQVLFFNLGTPPATPDSQGVDYDTEMYDSNGIGRGPTNKAWEIAFACGTNACTDSATDSSGQTYAASLQFNGQVWTAHASVVNATSALNEFIYFVDSIGNAHFYAPPGWLAATSTALSASPTTAPANTPIMLTATVSEVRGVVPTGSVTFSSGGTALGSAVALTNGVATTTVTLTVGTHNITAVYTPDASSPDAEQSTSNAQSVTIPAKPTVNISVLPTTITLGQGANLTWSTSGATTCMASGAWSGTEATAGTQPVTPTNTGMSNYSLTCTGPGGSNGGSASLTVNAATVNAPSHGGGGGLGDLDALVLGLLASWRLLRSPHNLRRARSLCVRPSA